MEELISRHDGMMADRGPIPALKKGGRNQDDRDAGGSGEPSANTPPSDYAAFLASKAVSAPKRGLDTVPALAHHLFAYQAHCVDFLLRCGSGGLFLDTGLGKTLVQLEWAKHAAEATNGYALILTPLAVARQIERDAVKFGYDARVIREQSEARPGINICNYDRLEKLTPDAFGAVALDESSILKSFTGKTTRALIEAFKGHRFRLCATATPAPNDHMELGQHAEFLGIMPSNEMLMRWFIADQTEMGRYRLKAHGERDFWDWTASWARCAETPADLGDAESAARFVLPPLNVRRHRAANSAPVVTDGLFAADVMSATNMHDVKRQTADARADVVAALVNNTTDAWVVWCDTDYEADALAKRIPDAVEVRGSHSVEAKESRLAAFADGTARVIISKPSICGFGLNWQHAAHMAFVGRSFSYESWYQAVRRCWRFGQTRPVECHLIVAEGEDAIGRVIDRKAGDHAKMKQAMRDAMRRNMGAASVVKVPYNPTFKGKLPSWLN